MYADVEGNIAYQSTGEIPIRVGYDGSWPVPGWSEDYQRANGLVPFDDLPRMFNPPRDYVASANNKVIASDEPFFSIDFDLGYRAARIEQMIEDWRGTRSIRHRPCSGTIGTEARPTSFPTCSTFHPMTPA